MTKRWATRNIGLFSGAPQAENFRDMIDAYPVRVVRRSLTGSTLAVGTIQELPKTYAFGGASTVDGRLPRGHRDARAVGAQGRPRRARGVWPVRLPDNSLALLVRHENLRRGSRRHRH